MVLGHGVSALRERAEKAKYGYEHCAFTDRVADRSSDAGRITVRNTVAGEIFEAIAEAQTQRYRSADRDTVAGADANRASHRRADRCADSQTHTGTHRGAAPHTAGRPAARTDARACHPGGAGAFKRSRSHGAILYRGAAQRRSADGRFVFRERLAGRELYPCEHAYRQYEYGTRGRRQFRRGRDALYTERKLLGDVRRVVGSRRQQDLTEEFFEAVV